MRRIVAAGAAGAIATIGMYALPSAAQSAGYDFVLSWGSLGSGEGEFNAIHEVETANNGSVYTVETGNQRVQNFSPQGTFRLMWGNPGPGGSSEPGEFNTPQDVAVGWDSRVYVADVRNHRIQWFTPEGVLGGAWGTEGTADGQFEYAADIATAPDGTVYVADFNNGRIQRFTRDGGFLSSWTGQFDWLTGIAVGTGQHGLRRRAGCPPRSAFHPHRPTRDVVGRAGIRSGSVPVTQRDRRGSGRHGVRGRHGP